MIQLAVAAIVIYSGGTKGLQNTLIIATLPFSVFLLLMGIAFFKEASKDPLVKKTKNSKVKKAPIPKLRCKRIFSVYRASAVHIST